MPMQAFTDNFEDKTAQKQDCSLLFSVICAGRLQV